MLRHGWYAMFFNMQGPLLFTFYFLSRKNIWTGQVGIWFTIQQYCSCLTCLLRSKPHTHICYM